MSLSAIPCLYVVDPSSEARSVSPPATTREVLLFMAAVTSHAPSVIVGIAIITPPVAVEGVVVAVEAVASGACCLAPL